MGPSLKNFWLAIAAAATAATDVATTAAFLVRTYEDEDLRGPEERCESHRRLLLTAVLAFLLNIGLSLCRDGRVVDDYDRGPRLEILRVHILQPTML
jgi:hypothetical protein